MMMTETTTSTAERRIHDRKDLFGVQEIHGASGHGYILDLTSGGMRVRLDRELQPGEEVSFRMELAAHSDTPHSVAVVGLCAWSRPGESQEQWEAGIEFGSPLDVPDGLFWAE